MSQTGRTWTDMQTTAQRISKDTNPETLIQLKLDMNEGYARFMAKLARYFTRKQQFTDLVEGQQIYQTPVDCTRILGMTVMVSNNFQPPVAQIRNEYEWRNITAVSSQSNYPMWYFNLGNDSFALWPIPSQDVVNGLRLYYQPSSGPMTVDDITNVTTSATVTVTQGSNIVTASSSVFTPDMATLAFQTTDTTDRSFYEIVSATATTLTLKSAYTSTSGSGHSWRIGQLSSLPGEYDSAPINYALWTFFSANGNEGRAEYHRKLFEKDMQDCLEEYSSSGMSAVIVDEGYVPNPWLFPPPAAP